MNLIRKPSQAELNLLKYLIAKSTGINISTDLDKELLVQTMADGGMGSLKLFPNGLIEKDRKFGSVASDYEFEDEDDVTVLATLYLDQFDELFELDMWKTDFSPLIKFPDTFKFL